MRQYAFYMKEGNIVVTPSKAYDFGDWTKGGSETQDYPFLYYPQMLLHSLIPYNSWIVMYCFQIYELLSAILEHITYEYAGNDLREYTRGDRQTSYTLSFSPKTIV